MVTDEGISRLLSKSLIQLDKCYSSQKAFFIDLYNLLLQQQHVKESYLNTIIIREQEYPTGLVTPVINIAIPHTTPDHINKPFIAITKLSSPLIFTEMGSTSSQISVNWIFALGVTTGDAQIELLQKLMALFSQKDQIQLLTKLTSTDEIYNFFSFNLK